MQSLLKLQWHVSWNKILKFISNHERPKRVKAMLSKNNKNGSILPDFKAYYKASVIKIAWYYHKNKHRDHGTEESTEIRLHIYSQMIFNNSVKTSEWGKGQSLQQIMLTKVNVYI